MIVIRSRPIWYRLLGRKLTWEYVGHAAAWSPYFWHNPGWTKVRIGSRRHHLGINSRYLYRRRLRSYRS